MAKYSVTLVTTIERSVVVEANSADEAAAKLQDRLSLSGQDNMGDSLWLALPGPWQFSNETLASSGDENDVQVEQAPLDEDADIEPDVL